MREPDAQHAVFLVQLQLPRQLHGVVVARPDIDALARERARQRRVALRRMRDGHGGHAITEPRRIADALHPQLWNLQQLVDQVLRERHLIGRRGPVGRGNALRATARGAMLLAQPHQVVGRCRQPCKKLGLGSAGFMPARQLLGPAAHGVGIGFGKQRFAPPQHAQVRPEKLVGGTGQEIAAQARDLGLAVRHELHGIDVHQRTRGLRQARQLGNRVDRTGHVARVVQCQEPGTLVEERPQLIRLDTPAVAIDGQPAHLEPAVFGQPQPRRYVALVIHARDDELIARLPVAAERTRHLESQHGHRLAEHDFPAGGCSQQFRHRRVRPLIDRIGGLRGLEIAPEVAGRMDHRRRDRLGDQARHLRACRVIQVDVAAGQGRKLAADEIDGEPCHACSPGISKSLTRAARRDYDARVPGRSGNPARGECYAKDGTQIPAGS